MASKEWKEWHLTPNGWVEGTFQHDFGRNQVTLPENRVLTCVYKETIGPDNNALSGYGQPGFYKDTNANVTWDCSNTQLISELLEKFGSCPEHL